jgi:MoaA/NifB/PqqE/SkfB family radical SAM enzyme
LTQTGTTDLREIPFPAHALKPQEIISGRKRIWIRLRIRSRITWIIFRNYRSVTKSMRLLSSLLSLRQSALGESKVAKYARVDGRIYMGLYTPGFPSMAFDAFILGELNRILPLDRPVNRFTCVLLSITKKCPLRCEHCSEWETLNGEEKLSLADLKSVVAGFQQPGTGQFHFSGGEPLRRMDDLCELLRSVDRKTECWVLTSGYDLDAESAARLKSAGLTGVVISLDHYIPGMHNRFRGSGKSFERAVDATRNAIDAGLVTAISLCATNTFVNAENLHAYAEMARKLGVSYIQILEPRAVGHYRGREVELTRDKEQLLEDFFTRMNHDKAFAGYPVVLYHGYYQRRIGCFSAGSRHVYMDAEGNLMDCPFCRNTGGNVLYHDLENSIRELKEKGCGRFRLQPS